MPANLGGPPRTLKPSTGTQAADFLVGCWLGLRYWSRSSFCARVRVEVSDGYHTASDESDTSFSVPDKPPPVGILTPEPGSVITLRVTLTGYGHDLEEGELSGVALQWASDRDGVLGTGARLRAGIMSQGPHTLWLTATDSLSQTATASVTVTVRMPFHTYLPLVTRNQ